MSGFLATIVSFLHAVLIPVFQLWVPCLMAPLSYTFGELPPGPGVPSEFPKGSGLLWGSIRSPRIYPYTTSAPESGRVLPVPYTRLASSETDQVTHLLTAHRFRTGHLSLPVFDSTLP